jgi:hypothetical protein
MGRQRGFLPPAKCQQRGNPPALGQILIPEDKWRCMNCLRETLPGRDSTSKSMSKMVAYGHQMREVFDLEAEGSTSAESRSQAEWARIIAAEIRKQGTANSMKVARANGEALPPQTERFLYDTLSVPDLAAVEASFDRTRLLSEQGADVAAMGVDAANAIQAGNSLEKMLAHQLAAAHKATMEMIGSVDPNSHDASAHTKRLNAFARCMTAYQHGLLTLQKLRQNGNQRITVQYVNVDNGSRAVIGDVVKSETRAG